MLFTVCVSVGGQQVTGQHPRLFHALMVTKPLASFVIWVTFSLFAVLGEAEFKALGLCIFFQESTH